MIHREIREIDNKPITESTPQNVGELVAILSGTVTEPVQLDGLPCAAAKCYQHDEQPIHTQVTMHAAMRATT
jgi:hypothetical protein